MCIAYYGKKVCDLQKTFFVLKGMAQADGLLMGLTVTKKHARNINLIKNITGELSFGSRDISSVMIDLGAAGRC